MLLRNVFLLMIIVCTQWTPGGTKTSFSCADCDGGNVTCVDGVCLPRCMNETSSGDCLQCRDSRFYGKQCENNCPQYCLNFRCHLNNSRIVCTEGCEPGKKGDNCGVDCLKGCKTCDRYGDKCTGPCKPGYYGNQCENSCSTNCEGSCEKQNGKCHRCKAGYQGHYCDTTCPSTCSEWFKTHGCTYCFLNRTIDDICKTSCPQNCSICEHSTAEHISTTFGALDKTGDTSDSPTLPTADGSSETLKIVCAVLGTMLCTAAVIFIYRKCTKYGLCKTRTTHGSMNSPQFNQVTKYRCSAEHSASSQYMASKYYEIQEENMDSSVEDQLITSDQDGQEVRKPTSSPLVHNPTSASSHQNPNFLDLRCDGHLAVRQDNVVPKLCNAEKRARSWGCETNGSKLKFNFSRPHSDSDAPGIAFFEQKTNVMLWEDDEEDPITQFERTCDVTNISVKYLTPSVVQRP